FSCLLCLGIQLPNTVKANEVNKYQSVMVQYLEAFKNYDIDTIVDISKDSRAVTKEEYKNMLMEFKYDPNQKLKSYEITGSRKIDNGEIFSVKTEFLNGAIYNMEFTVSYID
ncbi:beta-2 toxin CPB2, partial [Clostridium perfringens]|nr:beta-2 toxin CPB2 [Clostridium perfringens]